MSFNVYGGSGVVPQLAENFYGSGYGEKVEAPAEVQALYQGSGKAPHFDSSTGVYFDGEKAYVFDSSSQLGEAALESNLATGKEKSLVLGNGTEGNLFEHANHPSSVYMLDVPAGLVSEQ